MLESTLPSEPCYLIVGAGFAAALNYATLKTTAFGSDRIAGLPVVQVGEVDPWTKFYGTLRMGQWPVLLAAPEFPCDFRINEADFLLASEFSKVTACVLNNLNRLSGRVVNIRREGEQYLVTLDRDGLSLRAKRIDICTGPGPDLRLPDSKIESATLLKEYDLQASEFPLTRKRLFTGSQFLSRQCVPPYNAKICIVGAGATAAWCVERALANDNRVFWVSNTGSFEKAYPASGRNDALREGNLCEPNFGPLSFHESAELTKVREQDDGVSLQFEDRSTRRPFTPGDGFFHQVVFAAGQEPDAVSRYLDQALYGELSPITSGEPAMKDLVGLQTLSTLPKGGDIRILGAAALQMIKENAVTMQKMPRPDAMRKGRYEEGRSALNKYRNTLCHQARVDIGFTLSAFLICLANRYFDQDQPNTCVNSGTAYALSRHFGEFGATSLIAQRGERRDPWTSLTDLERNYPTRPNGLPKLLFENHRTSYDNT